MLPELLFRGLPSLLMGGMRLMNGSEQKEIQLQRLEQEERLNEIRLQFQALQEKEKQVHTQAEKERDRLFQMDMEAERQRNSANEKEHDRFFQQGLEQVRQKFQSQESALSRQAQQDNLFIQLNAQRTLQVEMKRLDSELSKELKRLDRQNALNALREQRRQSISPLVNVAEDLLLNDPNFVAIHVFFAPPTVRFDSKLTEKDKKGQFENLSNETELSSTIRDFLNTFNDEGRRVIFHGGGWQTRSVHSETAARVIFRELRSEPTIILETFAEGYNYYVHIAFWGDNWDDLRYKRVFSFNWFQILCAFVRQRTLERQSLNYTETDLLKFFGKSGLDNYKHNVNILQREEEARSIGMSAADIQKSISALYANVGEDVEQLSRYISLHHNAVLGLLIDEYYLLHAPLHKQHSPLMPLKFAHLVKAYQLEGYQQLVAGFAPYYEAMYELLIAANPMSSADFYLDLSECCHLLGDATASERALYKSVKAFLHWRGVETQVAASCLTYLQVPLAYQYVRQTDMNYIDKVNALCQKVFPNQPIPLITTAALSTWERKQREEAERKRREEEARQEAERKRKEELLRKSPFTAHINGVPFDMVFVQGGTFQMGSNNGESDEKPIHAVKLSDFHIGKYPVTQAQWRAVMGNNPSYFQGCDNCPVEGVSWEDVQRFITKLNKLSKAQGDKGRYCLPTEAQWEYAARGGQLSKRYRYSGSNNLDKVGWYNVNSSGETHAVGGKGANELGLYDMSGNVWEWCSDWYGGYSDGLQENPIGAAIGTNRVFRGGSWDFYAQLCCPTRRGSYTPALRDYTLGCRLGWFPS